MKKVLLNLLVLFAVVSLSATQGFAKNQQKKFKVDEVYGLFVNDGMTCKVQEMIFSLTEEQVKILKQLVDETISPQDIETILDSHEHCPDARNLKSNTGGNNSQNVFTAALPTYYVENIEEESGSGGHNPIAIYFDSGNTDWMCGRHWYEPPDYIFEYFVPNAYDNRSKLKIYGTNSNASKYIKNPTQARVYRSGTIRACVGSLKVWWYSDTGLPKINDSRVWVK